MNDENQTVLGDRVVGVAVAIIAGVMMINAVYQFADLLRGVQ